MFNVHMQKRIYGQIGILNYQASNKLNERMVNGADAIMYLLLLVYHGQHVLIVDCGFVNNKLLNVFQRQLIRAI